MGIVSVSSRGIAKATHQTVGGANMLPPVNRLVEVGRKSLRTIKSDLARFDDSGLWQRSQCLMDKGREPQYVSERHVFPVSSDRCWESRVSPRQRIGEQQPVSYTHLRAHETRHDLVCRLLLEKKK